MRHDEHESEKIELLNHFIENLQSSDRDLFDGIEPGCHSRTDMDLLDLALFMAPVVQFPNQDCKGRLRALTPQFIRLPKPDEHSVDERARQPLSQIFKPVVRFVRAVAAFLVALIAEPIPRSLELRSIDTFGQSWYKTQTGRQGSVCLGENVEMCCMASFGSLLLGFRAVA